MSANTYFMKYGGYDFGYCGMGQRGRLQVKAVTKEQMLLEGFYKNMVELNEQLG